MKDNELREKIENILKLDFNDDDQTESIISLINKEVINGRIDELEIIKDKIYPVIENNCPKLFNERIEKLESELNEVENERGEKNGKEN